MPASVPDSRRDSSRQERRRSQRQRTQKFAVNGFLLFCSWCEHARSPRQERNQHFWLRVSTAKKVLNLLFAPVSLDPNLKKHPVFSSTKERTLHENNEVTYHALGEFDPGAGGKRRHSKT